jgi:23S rRNA (uracil1939-C5)-methyltransferase
MPAIAASGVSRVVYVSCNPGALAKDASFLAKDYRLVGATPIDQFFWSAQVESVCVFERKSKERLF